MFSYLSHLQCTACHKTFSPDELHNTCRACGKILFARYDLDALRKKITRAELSTRVSTLWRWHELLPVRAQENVITLGEGGTPLLHARTIGRAQGFEHLYIKEEGLNPTGSFKARGMAVAVSRAKELGITKMATPSAGNAAGALAAYGAAAGMETYVFMPRDAPTINALESFITGAQVYLVNGLISDAGKIVKTLAPPRGWFDVSTLKEPYRAEGKKTMGLELAAQFDWQLPDAIVYPTGGGTGLIGVWKAFDELEQLGWIDSARPKMISVQAKGCAPIVAAFNANQATAVPWANAQTIADGLRVPAPFADYLILNILRESKGTALAVSDDEIRVAMNELARGEGLFAAPEGAATYGAFKHLANSGFLQPNEHVVLFNTGAGLKYPQLVHADFPILEPNDPEVEEQIK